MLKSTLTKLTLTFLILFAATAAHSQETQPTPTTPSAATSPTTPPVESGGCDSVDDCLKKLDTANRRIQKAIDAYEHAIASGNAKDEVIAAHRLLINLMKEGMAIKDQFIADLKANNEWLRKQVYPSKSWLQKTFGRIGKFLIFAAGAYFGKGL